MKALSLYQPWATLIALKEKSYETRHWLPKGQLKRGELLAIHASSRWTRADAALCYRAPFREVLLQHRIQFPDAQLPRGAVLCIVRFVDIFYTEDIAPKLSAQERAFGNYQPQRFAWQLEVIERLQPPVIVAGQPGLWDWQPPAPAVAVSPVQLQLL